MQACAGIQVVEFGGSAGVASLCGQLFAGLGARVIVVEEADPSQNSSLLSLDAETYRQSLRHAGKEIVPASDRDAAIGIADVILIDRDAGPLPGWAEPAVFEQVWPNKILCVVSLFGRDGPRRDWIGNELIAEAAGALMACNGYPERLPVTSGLPYALHTAALFAFNAVMTALWERDRSTLGQVVDLAVVDCIVAILGNFLPSYFISGKSPKRIGNRHTIAAPWNIYPASDGTVVICTGTGGAGWWAKVMAVLGRPDLVDDPRYATEADRVRNVDEVDAIVGEWTARRTMRETVDLFTAAGLPVSEISTVEAMLADPHYRDLRRMILDGEAGALPGIGIPLKVGNWVEDAAPGAREPEHVWEDHKHRGRGDRTAAGPLAGLRVLEFASRTSVPLAGRLMADFGAEVIKIEPLKGDALRGAGQQVGGSSYLFHINNAGKRSIVINPNEAEGQALILELARHADVFMENLAPGSLAKMGLGYEALKAVNPSIVYCSVSGFGARSGYGSKRALDTVVQAACGLMHMTGYPDHHPVKLGISAVDLTTATATMAAVLAGLRERQATGRGGNVDLAMADIGVWMTQSVWPDLLVDGRHPVRQGNRNLHAFPHDAYLSQDGRLVAIAVERDVQWKALVSLIGAAELGAADLATLEGRLAKRERIEAIIAEWVSQYGADRIATACQEGGVPAAVVRNLVELCADPEVGRRRMIVEIEHPTAGPLRLLGNPMALSRTPARIARTGAPLLGQHTREILSGWLSLPDATLETLEGSGLIINREAPAPARAVPELTASASGN